MIKWGFSFSKRRKSIFIKFKSFFIKLYEAIKEKVIRGYMFVSGKFKRIGNSVIDTSTGEVIEEIKPKYIGKALKNFIVDTLCANVLYEKPTTIKGRIIRGLSVFGTIGLLAATIIAIEGISFTYLLYLKVVALLYLMLVILKFTFYMYSLLEKGRCNIPVESIEGEVLAITYNEAVADEETFDNQFFTSEEEEKKFHHELADFVRSKNLRPELVYYMFCYEKKAKNTKLDNDMTNFLMIPNNSEAVIKFIGRYPKLSKSIMPNGYFDATYSKSFNRYLLPIMFEPNSSLTLARYTKYFYRLVNTLKE